MDNIIIGQATDLPASGNVAEIYDTDYDGKPDGDPPPPPAPPERPDIFGIADAIKAGQAKHIDWHRVPNRKAAVYFMELAPHVQWRCFRNLVENVGCERIPPEAFDEILAEANGTSSLVVPSAEREKWQPVQPADYSGFWPACSYVYRWTSPAGMYGNNDPDAAPVRGQARFVFAGPGGERSPTVLYTVFMRPNVDPDPARPLTADMVESIWRRDLKTERVEYTALRADYDRQYRERLGTPNAFEHAHAGTMAVALLQPEEDMHWIVQDVLPEGLVVLMAKQKAGKTWLALNIARAVITGDQAFGKFATTESEVLYISLEDGEKRMRRRGRKLNFDDLPSLVTERLHLRYEWDRLDTGGLAALEKFLDERPMVKLVIIDVWDNVRPAPQKGMNAYQADRSAARPLHEMANRRGVCVLLIHHTKQHVQDDWVESGSGSNGLPSVADALLRLVRSRGTNRGKLQITGRDIECEGDVQLILNRDGPWVATSGVGDGMTSVASELTPLQSAVVRAIGDGHVTPATIRSALGTQGNGVWNCLARLISQGRIVKEAAGTYRLVCAAVDLFQE